MAKRSVRPEASRPPAPRAAGPGSASPQGARSASSPNHTGESREGEVELSTGTRVTLDGDLVFLIDQLYRDFALTRGFAPSYGDVQRELTRLLDQMDPAATRDYFAQSLFLNYVTYENEMAERLAEKIADRARRAQRR